MEQLPVQILPDGKSGAPDDAFGLEDSGESSEGHGTDDRHEGFFVVEVMTQAVDSGRDFCRTGEKSTSCRGADREFLNPDDQNGEQHDVASDDNHSLTGRGDDILQRRGVIRLPGGWVCQNRIRKTVPFSVNVPGLSLIHI